MDQLVNRIALAALQNLKAAYVFAGLVDGLAIHFYPGVRFDLATIAPHADQALCFNALGAHPPPQRQTPRQAVHAGQPRSRAAERRGTHLP